MKWDTTWRGRCWQSRYSMGVTRSRRAESKKTTFRPLPINIRRKYVRKDILRQPNKQPNYAGAIDKYSKTSEVGSRKSRAMWKTDMESQGKYTGLNSGVKHNWGLSHRFLSLSRLQTSKFSMISFHITSFICSSARATLTFFSMTSAFVQKLTS